ncbi:MAG: hypothetical protein HOI34_10415 [Rhodospirillaceae bacterium]|nr:hypothetical protein [Rhodospirillaceae bacterium]
MLTMPNDIRLEQIVESMDHVLKAQARIYMHLAREAAERFGRDGERSIRLGLRAYGHWRGKEMQEAHHAAGHPVNMETLLRCWDNASTYVAKDTIEGEGRYTPNDVEFDVFHCPASEAWKDSDFHQMGHWYCDEFHQAAARTYHPDGNVTIHENLMKGDDRCHFRWLMPPDAPKLDPGEPTEMATRLGDDYVASSEIDGAWKALKRSNRLLGGHYFTCTVPIIERHGEEGRAAVVAALKSWGAERGRLLRQRHEGRGVTVSLEAFWSDHDLPARIIWPVREIEVSDGRVVVEIDDTPQDRAFADHDHAELGALWYEASYPAMAEAYWPGTLAHWELLRSRGDETNRLVLERQS